MLDPQQKFEVAFQHVLDHVRRLADLETPGGNQLDHALRTAETLRRQRGDAILVAAGLLHDIGKVANQGEHEVIGALRLRGFVHPEVVWLVRLHVVAQRVADVPEPARTRLVSHRRFNDLLALVAADAQPDPMEAVPPLEAFYNDVRSVILQP